MKYLDERLIFDLAFPAVTESKTYVYFLSAMNESAATAVKFIGNVFLQEGQESISIDCTDIIRNLKWDGKVIVDKGVSMPLQRKFNVVLTLGSARTQSNYVDVMFAYRYPNRKRELESDIPFYQELEGNQFLIPLQGRYVSGGVGYFRLTPRLPYVLTENYTYPIVGIVSTQLDGEELWQNFEDKNHNIIGEGIGLTFAYPTSYNNVTLKELLNVKVPIGKDIIEHQGFQYDAETDRFYLFTPQDGVTTFYIGNEMEIYDSVEWNIPRLGETKTFTLSRVLTERDIEVLFDRAYLYIGAVDSNSGYNYVALDLEGMLYYDVTPQPGDKLEVTFMADGNQSSYGFYLNPSAKIVLYHNPTENFFINLQAEYIAEVDVCPSRYYLQWQDRYGSFQSQPFNDKVTFSEDFEREYTEDYKGEKHLSNISITPKWKVNTDWISEEYYPYYESLYISPYLVLYDTQEDKSYNVTVKDNYTEKTYRNQKKLINITLELEENKQQNILY